jgi:hypothetical protein
MANKSGGEETLNRKDPGGDEGRAKPVAIRYESNWQMSFVVLLVILILKKR